MSSTKSKENLVWIDMEMSGLDPDTDVILEIATIVTDKDLNILSEGPVFTIRQKPELFDQMDEWNRTHHSESGLWDKVVSSTIGLEQAEQETLDFIKKYTEPKVSPLCGNSIAQDRLFISKYMPLINNHLHYRMVDVSTIKELTNRWYPGKLKAPDKKNLHRALDDIRESIDELKFYRSSVFKEEIT